MAVCMLWPSACYGRLHAMAVCMLWPSACYGRLHAMAVCMLWSSACYGRLHAMVVCMLWPSACYLKSRASQDLLSGVYLLCTALCRSPASSNLAVEGTMPLYSLGFVTEGTAQVFTSRPSISSYQYPGSAARGYYHFGRRGISYGKYRHTA